MAHIELHHPVTDDNAREFVEETCGPDVTDTERDTRVRELVAAAAQHRQWLDSLDPLTRELKGREPVSTFYVGEDQSYDPYAPSEELAPEPPAPPPVGGDTP